MVWNNSSIEVILRNPTYAGFVHGDRGAILPGLHEPIIAPATWEAVQKTLPTRSKFTTRVKRPFPLIGLIRCGHCDSAMTVSYVKKPNGHVVPYYRCSRTFHKGWGSCPIKQVNANKIEKWLVEQLRMLAAAPTLLDSVLAGINNSDEERAHPLRERSAQLLARTREVSGRIDNLVNAVAAGGASFDSIRTQLALEERNKQLIESELSQVQGEIERTAGSPLDPATVRQALGDFELLYAIAKPEEQRELLHLLIRRIVYRGPAAQTSVELYSDVQLQDHGSILRASQLPGHDLNMGPAD